MNRAVELAKKKIERLLKQERHKAEKLAKFEKSQPTPPKIETAEEALKKTLKR